MSMWELIAWDFVGEENLELHNDELKLSHDIEIKYEIEVEAAEQYKTFELEFVRIENTYHDFILYNTGIENEIKEFLHSCGLDEWDVNELSDDIINQKDTNANKVGEKVYNKLMEEYDNTEIPLVVELEKAPDNVIYEFEGDYWCKDLLIDYLEENKEYWYRVGCYEYEDGDSEITYWPINRQGEVGEYPEVIMLLTRDDFKSIDEIRALEFSEEFIKNLV